jgi:hypothetical protein
MTVAAGLSATKAGFDLIKGVREIFKHPEPDLGEISARLLELQELMLQARDALAEAQEENRRLQRLLDDREEQKALGSDLEMVPDGQFFIRKTERDAGIFVPYCPTCWGDGKKLVPLAPYGVNGAYRCAIHDKTIYRTKAYAEAIQKSISRSPLRRTIGWLDRG